MCIYIYTYIYIYICIYIYVYIYMHIYMCVLNNLTPHTRRREATKGQRAQQAAMAVFEDDVLGYVQNKSQIKTMCYWYVIVTYVVTCVCSTKGGCAQQMASCEDDLYGYVVMFAFKCLGMLL